MKTFLRLTTMRTGIGLPRLDPLGFLLRLDAAYRDARRREEATQEQLLDMGLTRADLRRIHMRER